MIMIKEKQKSYVINNESKLHYTLIEGSINDISLTKPLPKEVQQPLRKL
jgi:hypothetical protein